MKNFLKIFTLVLVVVVAFFLYDIVLEAIHHGYNIGVDYTYEQGMRDVHVELESADSDSNDLDSAYEPLTSPKNNAIE